MRVTVIAMLIGSLLTLAGCANHDNYRYLGDTAPNQAISTSTGAQR